MLGRFVSRIGVRGRLGTGSVRAIASAAAALAVLTMIVGAGWNNGNPVDKVRLLSGVAWLPSSPVGQLTLLDGSSAEIAAQVKVAPPRNQLDAVQSGTTAYAINRTSGSILRVDGGTFDLTPPVTPIPGAGEGLHAYASADALYALDTQGGVLTQTDPATLASRSGLLPLAAQAATVDDAGRLWVLDTTTGDLTWIKNGQRDTRRGAIQPGSGSGRLVLAGGSPVLIDIQDRTAATLNPDTGKAENITQLDLRPNDTIQVGGSPHALRLYVVTSRGVLTVCDLTATSCGDAVPLDNAGPELGAPIETGDRVFIPDYTSGRVWIVELKEKRVVAQPQVLSPAGHFQLLTRDGIVFYNDPDSERAGVIRLDGGVVPVSKYDPKSPDKVLPTTPPTVGNTPPTQSPPPTTSTSTNTPRSTVTTAPKPDPPITPPTGSQGSRPTPPTTGQPAPTTTGQPAPTTTSTTPPDVSPAVRIVVSKSQPQIGEDVNLKATADSGPDPTSARWTFGDGQGSNDVLTTHRWDNAQTYQVAVQATFPNGKTSTASLPIQVASTTTPPPALTITTTGSGTGTVTSDDPTGISCPPTCTAQFAEGTVVRLTATTSGGSVFAGWSGERCSGTGTTCRLAMPANAVNITGTFNPPPPTPTPTPTPTPLPLSKRKCPPTSSADQSTTNGLEISSPRQGDSVTGMNESHGTVLRAHDQHLWLFLCAPGIQRFYFVTDGHREVIPESNGTWRARFYVATEWHDENFLYAVVVNAEDSRWLDQTRDQMSAEGVGSPYFPELPQSARYFRVAVRCCS